MLKYDEMFLAAIVALLLFLVAAIWLSTPVVYVSHSSGDCVKVDSLGDKYSCNNLPERYVVEWVR